MHLLRFNKEKQNAHIALLSSVSFSPDGKTIVSGSYDQTLKVWDSGVSALTPSTLKPITYHSCACGSFPGAQGREAERA